MARKHKPDNRGFVYSTDPGFRFDDEAAPGTSTPDAAKQRLIISLDTRQRAGKAVTLITGFTGKEDDLQELGRRLKAFCGTGGSVKDGMVLIQGDQRDKIMQWLGKNGYSSAKRK